MGFKSEAQRQRALEMVKKGLITSRQYDEWNKDTPKKIPQRVKPKKAKK